MRKLFGLLLVAAVVVGVAPYARSLGTPPAPPGVSANAWIPLGDAAGFVVSHGDSPVGSSRSPGVVKGYFVIRRENTWLRVDSGAEPTVHPANLDH